MIMRAGASLHDIRGSADNRRNGKTKSLLSTLSPKSIRRNSSTPRIQLGDLPGKGASAICETMMRRRSMPYFERLCCAGGTLEGGWQPPSGNRLSDMNPGALHDLQCIARRIVLERKLNLGGFVLGIGEDEMLAFSGSTTPDAQRVALKAAQKSIATALSLHGNLNVLKMKRLNGVTNQDSTDCAETVIAPTLMLEDDDLDPDADDHPGVDPSEKKWFNHCMSQYVGEMEKMLEQEEIHVDRRDYFTGYTASHWACKMGNEAMLTLCLEYNANLNIKSSSGYTPLSLACRQNHTAVCIILLDNGANANVRDNIGKLPCQVAHKKLPGAVIARLRKNANANSNMAVPSTQPLGIVPKKSSVVISLRSLTSSIGRTVNDDDDSVSPRNIRASWFRKKSTKVDRDISREGP